MYRRRGSQTSLQSTVPHVATSLVSPCENIIVGIAVESFVSSARQIGFQFQSSMKRRRFECVIFALTCSPFGNCSSARRLSAISKEHVRAWKHTSHDNLKKHKTVLYPYLSIDRYIIDISIYRNRSSVCVRHRPWINIKIRIVVMFDRAHVSVDVTVTRSIHAKMYDDRVESIDRLSRQMYCGNVKYTPWPVFLLCVRYGREWYCLCHKLAHLDG